MPKDDLRWQIQDAIERANEKAKMDKMESDLAGGLAVLMLPIIFGGVILLGIFGVPFLALMYLYVLIIRITNNITLGTLLNVALSIALCAFDISVIKHLSPRLKTGKIGKFTILYMSILLVVPWLAVAGGLGVFNNAGFVQEDKRIIESELSDISKILETSQPTNPSAILKFGESWNYNGVVFLVNRARFYSRTIYIDLIIANETNSDINFEENSQIEYYKLIDSNGKVYDVRPNGTGNRSIFLSTRNYGYGGVNPFVDNGDFFDKYRAIDYSQIEYFLFTINDVFGVQNATWRFESPR